MGILLSHPFHYYLCRSLSSLYTSLPSEYCERTRYKKRLLRSSVSKVMGARRSRLPIVFLAVLLSIEIRGARSGVASRVCGACTCMGQETNTRVVPKSSKKYTKTLCQRMARTECDARVWVSRRSANGIFSEARKKYWRRQAQMLCREAGDSRWVTSMSAGIRKPGQVKKFNFRVSAAITGHK